MKALHYREHFGHGSGATRPLPRDGAARKNSAERRPNTNSQATPKGLDQRSKLEDVVPKMARWRDLDDGTWRFCPRRLVPLSTEWLAYNIVA